ncbi:MAG TPA: VOC family protein [Actinomycetota bacterium]
MSFSRISVVIDCADPEPLAAFWSQALGHRRAWSNESFTVLVPPKGGRVPVLIPQRVPEPKTVKNRLHVDLHTTGMDAEVARLESLGATKHDVHRIEEIDSTWTVMSDPAGNEFCVVQDPD